MTSPLTILTRPLEWKIDKRLNWIETLVSDFSGIILRIDFAHTLYMFIFPLSAVYIFFQRPRTILLQLYMQLTSSV